MASVVKKIKINAPISSVFQLWENFENFPHFMQHVEEIESIGPDQTRWTIIGPAGTEVTWHAETTYVEHNRKISWVTTGGEIDTHGSVLFEELGPNETEVTLGLEYNVSTGAVGEAVVKLFDNPEEWIEDDLSRFKHFAESSDSTSDSRTVQTATQ